MPAPEVLPAGDSFLVARWIDGVTLNDCRRGAPPALFATLAEPLGALAARVAQTVVPEAPRRKTSVALATAQDRLRVARVRDRLGARTADALARLWDEHDAELDDGEEPVLVHGDFSGRNILVRVERDRCVVAGLIDWELAFPRQRAVGPGEPLRLRGPLPAGVHRGLRAWPRRAPARLVAAGPPPQRHAARRQLALAKAGPGVVADSREKLVGVVAEWP